MLNSLFKYPKCKMSPHLQTQFVRAERIIERDVNSVGDSSSVP